MKKIAIITILFLSIISCKNNELTREVAFKNLCEYCTNNIPYNFAYCTPTGESYATSDHGVKGGRYLRSIKIFIDKTYENYGWPPEKYKQLEQNGFITLQKLGTWGWQDKYQANLTKLGKEKYAGTYIRNITNGKIEQYLFDYQGDISFDINDLSISSNAKENSAEVIVLIKISNVALVQKIFSPIEKNEISQTINFKLYDNGWKIVENENSKKFIKEISAIYNPQHWLGD